MFRALVVSACLLASTLAFTPSPSDSILRPNLRDIPRHLSKAQPRAARRTLLAAADAAVPGPAGVSPTAMTLNLAKNIVGSGVLALAAGVAAFSGSRTALLPSMVLLLLLGGISGYTFSTIGRVGEAVGADTYRDTWSKVFGEKSGILPDATVVFMTAVAGLAYAIIIGDSFASIASLAGATGLLATPNAWIVALSVFVLLPLSLLRDLSSLAIGSVIGNAGTLYTMLFMWLRLIDGSYRKGGKYFAAIAEASQPSFAAASAARPLLNPAIFVLISMLASAFLAHYNAPKFYKELQAPKDGSSKVPTFNLVCAVGFGGAALLMGAVMVAGFLTFGSASQGLILNNYATSDPLAFLARVGIASSIIFSFPLNFVGLREGVLGMLGLKAQAGKTSVHWAATIALLCLTNGAALFIKDLGLVVSLGGAILGSALVYIFPALMAVYEKKGATGAAEKKFNVFLTGLGVFLAGLGAVMCLK